MVLRWARLGIGCAVLSCSNSSGAPPPRVLVGAVTENDAQVGIVATAHHARLFLCGGPSSYQTATHWFSAIDLDASQQIMAQDDSNGSFSVVGHIGPAGAAGVIALPDGSTLTFQASPTVQGTLAGLYEAMAPCGKVGLIVTQPAAPAAAMGQGACIPATATVGSSVDRILQVTPITPIARASDGTIHASADGSEISLVAAAAPAP